MRNEIKEKINQKNIEKKTKTNTNQKNED